MVHSDSRTAPSNELFEHTFFLEVERSTETQEHLPQGGCYRDYYPAETSGQNGRRDRSLRAFRFARSWCSKCERRNNVRSGCCHHSANPPPVWMTTFAEATTDHCTIWVRPLDYRNATVNTHLHARCKLSISATTEREILAKSAY